MNPEIDWSKYKKVEGVKYTETKDSKEHYYVIYKKVPSTGEVYPEYCDSDEKLPKKISSILECTDHEILSILRVEGKYK